MQSIAQSTTRTRDDTAENVFYALIIRIARRLLPVASSLAILALGGCAHGHSALRSHAPVARGFTLAEVRRAFAAEGLPLQVDYRARGTVFLSHWSSNLSVGDVVGVSVYPQAWARGVIDVLVLQGHKIVRARNVFVDFDPRAASARKARAALALLRRKA